MWPERPTCHNNQQVMNPAAWQVRDNLRHCNYCGSLHPEDLVKLLESGSVELGGSDWKYGYPHKFYVYTMFHNGDMWKWYNDHILDEGYSSENMKKLLDLLFKFSDIEFFFKDDVASGKKILRYSAPKAGYQRMTSRFKKLDNKA